MVLPVAQQGEDHTPHAFHGEFPDPTDSLFREMATNVPRVLHPFTAVLVLACPSATTPLWLSCPTAEPVWQPGKLRQQ